MTTGLGVSAKVFQDLVKEVYRLTGVVITEEKKQLMSGRLRRRVRALGLDSMDDYVKLLLSSQLTSDERDEFIDVVTTHKTSFFRTDSVWQYFATEVLPAAAKTGRPFEIWSAACSKGHEAYSIALECEAMRLKDSNFKWKLMASDVASNTVKQAKAGLFAKSDVRAAKISRPHLPWKENFSTSPEGEQANKELRAKIAFKTHNLLRPMSARFQVVFVRNVIIYFSEEDKQRVLRNIAASLVDGGIIVAGESESLLSHSNLFEYEAPCIYRKVG